MTAELQGKVAVITGGGRGLGRGVALEMASAGAAVVVADLYVDESGDSASEAVVREIIGGGGKAAASPENVASSDGTAAIVATALEQFGRVDILCTFAGNAMMQRIADVTEDVFDSSINVHLKGTFNCIRAVIPHMREHDYGRIITVSSRGAFLSPVPAYAAAKAGIMGLTAAIAMEVRGTGITANCLLPSGVTQLFSSTQPRPLGGMPVPQSTDPDDVAPLVAYLATEEASNINGQFLYASGGDVCVYAQPFKVTGANNILRKDGRWTISELGALIQPIAAT
jgi:3-oxoacyl-[acyl-carrier protein] reductase